MNCSQLEATPTISYRVACDISVRKWIIFIHEDYHLYKWMDIIREIKEWRMRALAGLGRQARQAGRKAISDGDGGPACYNRNCGRDISSTRKL